MRVERLNAAMSKYVSTWEENADARLERFALIRRENDGSAPNSWIYSCLTYSSLKRAIVWANELLIDFEILCLIDLDSGEHYDPVPTSINFVKARTTS
jgi:hypothetical protein